MSQVPIRGTEPDPFEIPEAPIPSGVIPVPVPESPILGPQLPGIPEDLQRFFDVPDTLRLAGEAKANEVRDIEARIKQIAATVPELTESLFDAPTRPGADPLNFGGVVDLLKLAIKPRFAGGTPQIEAAAFGDVEETKRREELIKTAIDDLVRLNGEIYWSNWEANIINSLPVFVRADEDLDFEKLVEATQTEGRIAPTGTKEFITLAIQTIKEAQEAERKEAEETASLLTRPGGSLAAFHRINPAETSSQDLIDQLVAAGRFNLPEGLTNEELRATLITGGMTAREADEQIFDAVAQAHQISLELREWDEANRRLMEEGEKLRSEEIISAVRRAQWLRAASQPLIAILAPTEWWLNNVTRPIVGGTLAIGRGLELGSDATIGKWLGTANTEVGAFAKWGQHYGQARDADMSIWQALRYTEEEWDANGLLKFGYEVVFDPISYLGFGIATKLTAPFPYLGKGVGAFERGFVVAAEYPWKVARAAFLKSAPRTLAFTGQRQANTVINMLKVQFESNFNIPVGKADPTEIRGLAITAIEAALDDPGGLDNLHKLGRGLLGWEGIGPEDTAKLVRDLGLDPDDFVNTGLMLQLNESLELTAGHGISKFLQPSEGAAHITRRIFGLQGTKQQIAVVNSFLRSRRTVLKSRALAPFDAPLLDNQLTATMANIRNSWIKANRQVIQATRYRQGIVASMLNGLDSTTRLVFIDGIDKYITQRAARAYLVFGFYGIANIAEVAIKTMSATGSIRAAFWRGAPNQRTAFAFHKLNNVPTQIIRDTPFNLGIALPEREISVLHSATASRLEQSTARRKLRQWSLAYNRSRSLRGIGESIGAGLQDVTLYNFGNRVTAAGRQNYYDKMYRKQINERASQQVQSVADAVIQETRNLAGVMDKTVVDGYRDALQLAIMSGDEDFMRKIPELFTAGKVRRGEAEKILGKHIDFPSDMIDLALKRVESGDIFAAGGMRQFERDARERIVEQQLTSPEVFEEHFGQILREYINVPATSQADITQKMAIIDEAIDTFQDTISNTLRAAIHYSDNLRSVEDSGLFFNEIWTNRINPIVDRASLDLTEATERVQRQFDLSEFADSFTDQARIDAFNALAKISLDRTAAYKTARESYSAIRDTFMQPSGINYIPPGPGRGNAFWDSFRTAVRKPWDDVENSMARMELESIQAKMRLTGEALPAPFDASRDTLSRLHVAQLYGQNPGDLERSIYLTDIMAVMPRNSFISKTMNRATQAATATGKTAEDLGWNTESVGRVYDGMVSKLRENPRIESGIEPMMVQLRSISEELTSLGYRRKALISDDAEVELRDSIERLSTRVFGRGERVTRIIKEVERAEVALSADRRSLALPSAAPVIAQQNAAMRQFREATRDDATKLQQGVVALQKFVTSERRNALPISKRFFQLSEGGLDIRRADLELENFIELNRTLGSSQAARVEKDAQWQRVLDEIDRLDVDIEATVNQAAEEFGKSFVPGSPGATVQETVQQSIQGAQRELTAARKAQTNARARIRRTTREDIPAAQIQLDTANLRVEQATEALSTARTTTVSRLQRGRRMARARASLEERQVNEIRTPGGPELTFTRKVAPDFTFQSETGLLDENLRFWNMPEGQTIRQDALDETNLRYGQDFPDYDNPTAFTDMMKMIFPFWQYEAHRWAFWLPREFSRHPGVWAGWGKYQDNTDGGYFDLPGLPIDINPLRGTIFMGGMRRLAMRDFPEYYDNFEGFAEIFDQLSRWGFYPGFPIGATMSMFGAASGKAQLGELLPPTARTVQGAIASMSPELGKELNDIFFSDRFRDFMTALEVDRLNFDNPDAVFGSDILAKKLLDQPLLPEEDEVWTAATRGIGTWTMLFEQTGLFKFSPEERRRVWELTNRIISEHRGIPIEQLEDMRRSGIQYEDVFDANQPEVDRALKVMNGWRRFSGASISLLPTQEGLARANIRQYWAVVTDEIEIEKEKLIQFQRDFERNPNPTSYSNWEFALKEKVQASISIIENLKKSETYKDVPVTIEDRRKAAEETGLKIFFNQFEEFRELYFQRELKQIWDEDRQAFVLDYDGLYLQQDLLTATLPDDQRGRFEEFISNNQTPLEALRRKVSKDFILPYKSLSRIILGEFSRNDRSIIRKAIAAGAANQERINLRREEGDFGEGSVVAEYESRVRTARRNLREVDPQLDAWLAFFNETKSVRTPQAQRLINQMIETVRVSGVESLASQ